MNVVGKIQDKNQDTWVLLRILLQRLPVGSLATHKSLGTTVPSSVKILLLSSLDIYVRLIAEWLSHKNIVKLH